MVNDFTFGPAGFAWLPAIVVFFANVFVVVIDAVFIAETGLLSVPDRDGVLGGSQVHIVGIPQYHCGQNMRVDAVSAVGLLLVGRIKKELGSSHYGMNAYLTLLLCPRRNGGAARAIGPQVVVIPELIPQGSEIGRAHV